MCPLCMKGFTSADDLHSHFEEIHNNEADSDMVEVGTVNCHK